MDRESTPEVEPEHVKETTHGAVEGARQELRELKRTLLLSKLREMKDLSRKNTEEPPGRSEPEA
jgi:hypothetical protein